jgi:hypothetical protein
MSQLLSLNEIKSDSQPRVLRLEENSVSVTLVVHLLESFNNMEGLHGISKFSSHQGHDDMAISGMKTPKKGISNAVFMPRLDPGNFSWSLVLTCRITLPRFPSDSGSQEHSV